MILLSLYSALRGFRAARLPLCEACSLAVILYCLWQCFLKPQKEHNPLNQKINSADEQVSRLNEKIKTAAGKKAQRKGRP